MTGRPTYRPDYYVGPVSVYVSRHDLTGDPDHAEAWVGDICVAGYDLDRVTVEHPDDPDMLADVVRDFRADQGEDAVEWMCERIEAWLGAET